MPALESYAVGEHIGWVLIGGRAWKKVYNEPSVIKPNTYVKMFVRNNSWYPLRKGHSFYTHEEKKDKEQYT